MSTLTDLCMKIRNLMLWIALPLFGAPNTGFYNNPEGSPLIDFIQSAKKSIQIEIYEMNDDQVLAALEKAAGQGIVIRIVKEDNPLGGPCKIFTRAEDFPDDSNSMHDETNLANCRRQKKLAQTIRAQGGKYVAFNKAELCAIAGQSCFQHGKIALFDSQIALISTGNFNDSNLCDLKQNPATCNRDYSMVTEDPEIVSGLNAFFEKDLAGKRYDFNSLMSKSLSQKLTVSPISLDNILSFIGSATKSLQIQNQYLEEPKINAAIVKAAQKGVKVEIMVSDVCNFGKPSASKYALFTRIFSEFDKNSIGTRLFNKQQLINGKPGYLHAKAIIVDNQRAWVGSMNGSTESATMNREYGIYFDNAPWIRALSQIMTDDYHSPSAQTWQQSLNCQKANSESEL